MPWWPSGALALVARAEDAPGPGTRSVGADGKVLHEFLPGARRDEVDLVLGPSGAERGGDGPSAGAGESSGATSGGSGDGPSTEPAPSLLYQGNLLSAPGEADPQADPGSEVSMQSAPGDGLGGEEAGRRSPTFSPDRQTELEGTLGYYASFNPTVAPFKRVTVFDSVEIDPTGVPVLAVSEPNRLEPIPVVAPSSAANAPRDRFWGSVVLDFSSGARVPLPMPGPGARILWWQSLPDGVALRFERDAAENAFAVLADGAAAGARGSVRLTFLVDVPRSYFGGSIPTVANDSLAAQVPPLDPDLGERARSFAAELGIERGDALSTTLAALVAHFRSFEESAEPPEDTGDVYLDLARGKRGICRHRSYGFIITALALGIPTRFAMNEAHSWVEVALPSRGWLRIDLGGAAAGLEAFGAQDHVLHRPAQEDTLPKPASYLRSYSQVPEGDDRVVGLPDSAAGRGATTSPATRGGGDSRNGRASRMGSRGAWGGRGLRRTPVLLRVDEPRYSAFRGRALTVTGRAVNAGSGQGIAGLRVEAILGVDGQEGRLLGVAVTDGRGCMSGSSACLPSSSPGTTPFPCVSRGTPATPPPRSSKDEHRAYRPLPDRSEGRRP